MKQFGGAITGHLKQQYSESPNWQDGKFQNLVETTMNVNIRTIPKLLYKTIFAEKGRAPQSNIPILPFDVQRFLAPSEAAKIIWYGHSVVLMRIGNKTLLIDPMFGPNASPIAPFPTTRFSENALDIIDQLPPIDLVLLTHDHYDHLDYASFQRLKRKTRRYFVAIGVGRHLVSWGVQKNDITEFDWWDARTVGDIAITFTPTRHFSGRGVTDRAKSLWGGWVFSTAHENIYFSGDGGYGEHFKEIGERLGPFDIGLMECGQYNEHWHQIHLYPEESVQAAIDAGVRKTTPVHWGAFALAQHHWKDPIHRFSAAAENKGLPIATPIIGEQFTVSEGKMAKWWESYL